MWLGVSRTWLHACARTGGGWDGILCSLAPCMSDANVNGSRGSLTRRRSRESKSIRFFEGIPDSGSLTFVANRMSFLERSHRTLVTAYRPFVPGPGCRSPLVPVSRLDRVDSCRSSFGLGVGDAPTWLLSVICKHGISSKCRVPASLAALDVRCELKDTGIDANRQTLGGINVAYLPAEMLRCIPPWLRDTDFRIQSFIIPLPHPDP